MNYHSYFAKAARPVETCVVGTGGFGQSFLGQAQRVPLLSARIAVDVTCEGAAAGLQAAGISGGAIRVCRTAREAKAAWDAGAFIAAQDLAVASELPVDVVVEATGAPRAAARHADLAIASGKHVALVTKEADSVVGPELAARAKESGLVVTTVDGDQPSLLIGLATWAEALGFDIVAAGKSSEYDFVFDPAARTLASGGRVAQGVDLSPSWTMGEGEVADLLEARRTAAAGFPLRAVPDLCELGVVANALALSPDRADLHAPLARIAEVPTIFAELADGGLMSGVRRLDVFHCLRKPDEISFAGGVFVVVRCEDATSWQMLAQKGHLVSRTGSTAMLFLPRHLLGLEAATSIVEAVVHGVSAYGADYRPRFDLVAVATEDLEAGRLLSMGGHHHTIAGVAAAFAPAAAIAKAAGAPFYLAADCRLAQPVAKGETITAGHLELPEGTDLLTLRRRQDARFLT